MIFNFANDMHGWHHHPPVYVSAVLMCTRVARVCEFTPGPDEHPPNCISSDAVTDEQRSGGAVPQRHE